MTNQEQQTSNFQVIRSEMEDRSTLLYEVVPPIPLSRYGEVVTAIDGAFMSIDPAQVGINPDTINNMRNGNRIAISPEGSSSVIRWAFTGWLDRHQAPAGVSTRGVADAVVLSVIAEM